MPYSDRLKTIQTVGFQRQIFKNSDLNFQLELGGNVPAPAHCDSQLGFCFSNLKANSKQSSNSLF